MLGRLARWLRILGYDTLYKRDISDRELIRIAKQEGRVILTRDSGLLNHKGVRCIFVRSDFIKEQLKEVLTFLSQRGFSIPGPFIRCPLCNGLLQEIPKAEAQALVPDHVYLRNNHFARCPGCGRIYWSGSHEERIRYFLADII